MVGLWGPTWGTYVWGGAHRMTLGFPLTPTDADKRAAVDYFDALRSLLPCEICRAHWTRYLAANPVDASSRIALVDWTRRAHNAVSARLGKPEWSIRDLFEYYMVDLTNPLSTDVLTRAQDTKRETALVVRTIRDERDAAAADARQVRAHMADLERTAVRTAHVLRTRNVELILTIVVAVLLACLLPLVWYATRRRRTPPYTRAAESAGAE